MASAKAAFLELVGKYFLKEATVTSATRPAAHYTVLELACPELRGAKATAGDKIQILLPGEGTRTYTPVGFDPAAGTFSLIAFVHGSSSPGARWAAKVTAGDRFRFVWQDSLAVDAAAVVFGDETSLGLVAASKGAAAVLEVSDVEAARGVGVKATFVARTAGDSHLAGVVDALVAVLREAPAARLVMSGKAGSIQAVRKALKARGVMAPQKVKAYWAPGKVGMD